MPDQRRQRASRPAKIALGAMIAALVLPASALAHKLMVFATANAGVIDGYAYFVPGERARDVAVVVTSPDGAVLAKATTDQNGGFHFATGRPVDHIITVDAGDGHVASTRVAAGEPGDTIAGKAASPGPDLSPASADLKVLIDDSIARQLRPLREEINAWQEKIWMHDVLGGIGWIFGLGGLAYGLTARRRAGSSAATPEKADHR